VKILKGKIHFNAQNSLFIKVGTVAFTCKSKWEVTVTCNIRKTILDILFRGVRKQVFG